MKKQFTKAFTSALLLSFALIATGCNKAETNTTDNNNSNATSNDTGDATGITGTATNDTDITESTAVTNIPKGSEDVNTAYLFAYFAGNQPENERLFYAISTDGYNFSPLNNGEFVFKSELGTECMRDPYIFLGEDGFYYMLATDMKSELGWASNRSIISCKSEDLINWTDETVIEIADKFDSTTSADRVWAPQAIFDSEKNQYMIYWATRLSEGENNKTIMWYAYSDDLKTLVTEPAVLFEPKSGNEAIDGDIICQNGKYYMYYKDETTKQIKIATAEKASGPYSGESESISPQGVNAEGSCIYKLIGEEKWIMLSDAYNAGYNAIDFNTAGTYIISGKVSPPVYGNPFIEERADPYVVKDEDGYYYFTSSYPATDVNNGYDRISNLLLVYHARPIKHLRKDCGSYANDSLYDPCRHARVKYVYISKDGIPILNMARSQIISKLCENITAGIVVK